MQRPGLAFENATHDCRLGGGDAFVDRLSCYYTALILGFFAVGITTMQCLDDEPIFCWCPSHFTDSHVNFTNKVCWTQNTYYLPIEESVIPKSSKGKSYISYYQWVPLALICQACLFYLPRPLWLMLNKKSGISVSTITDLAVECQKSLNSERRSNIMRYMTKLMGRFLTDLSRRQLVAGRAKGIFLAIYGNYLFIAYLVVKLVYLTNVVGQVFWMNSFLSTDYHLYGFRVLNKMVHGDSWSTSDRFPRVTLCDVSIREVGNIHNYTVQCALPLNLLNEKLYIFIWFWFFYVAMSTVASFLIWCADFFLTSQINFVRTQLIIMDKIQYNSRKDVNRFVRKFLKRDGMFLVRLVAHNTSDMIAAELLSGLWDNYNKNETAIERIKDKSRCDVSSSNLRSRIKVMLRTDLDNASEGEHDRS